MRSAASMLELIVAIVIMGIAMMTLPILLTQTQTNNAYTIQQEVILAGRTKIGDTFTYRWDENSLQGFITRVLLTKGDDELNATVESSGARRLGHVGGDGRRKFFTNPSYEATTPVNLKSDNGDLDDLDDFNSKTTLLIESNENTILDYHYKDFNLTTTVSYVSDETDYSKKDIEFVFHKTPITANSTNIKMVVVNIEGANISPFTLRTYSSNIGENELLRKNY